MARSSTPDFVSTTQVADALGISVSTVKRWVEEGILPAQKTAGGHRKLLLADVLELARQSNLPVRDAALLRPLTKKPASADLQHTVVALYDSLLTGDTRTSRGIIHGSYRNGMSIEVLADSIIAPAMRRIGVDWETGRIDVMHEHRASRECTAALHELKAVIEARVPRNRPRAVGGALEGDFSEIPTLLAQMVLLDAGWDAINLGPNTPLASFRRAISELHPRMIWLSISHLPPDKLPAREFRELYKQAERANTAVVVGGQALDETVRAEIPYTAYGDGLNHLAAFARTLHPRPRRPQRGRPRSDRSS
jgi:MerR family transcriptional regulator, light-induced transcriptional regulator